MFKEYVALTKPKLLRLNAFAAFGGYWVASQWQFDWWLLTHMLIGITLTMASACVINNYWDRELDKKMERTQERALPQGRVKPMYVLTYGIVLGVIGLTWLFVNISLLVGFLGLLGMFAYVVIYTMWLKRTSTWSTSIGGISGAMPPVVGYCAVQGEIDPGAWLLFILLFLWQPPHFWSLAIRRVEEYRAAGFPLLPVVKGVGRTKLQMIPYVLALIPVGILFEYYGYVGHLFLYTSIILSCIWLVHTLLGLKSMSQEKLSSWARVNFFMSINYLLVMFIVMMVDTVKA